MHFLALFVALQTFWNMASPMIAHRLPPAPVGYQPEYLDLNSDGKADAIKTITINDIPVLWLDDDGNMKPGDTEGDLVNDCLLLDTDKDGKYDFVVKYADIDGDGKADLQMICDYIGRGHYMVVLDEDHDGVFNYVDWETMTLECWQKNGISDFYTDYSGNSVFMKAHKHTTQIPDLRYNWENPFIFYDEDGDGLSEMAVRICDFPDSKGGADYHGEVNWFSVGIDLDNDNCEGNDFDFDMTINFRADKDRKGVVGFEYSDCVHPLKNMRGLPEADKFFPDPRIRQLTELIYADRKQVWGKTFGGNWDRAYFTFDEDDDCGRWERVELYEGRDPFKIGKKNGGVDNHVQSDVSGDRGEWDEDFSGKGNLYVSRFDGRIHLYGAEKGEWRVDQNTEYYQGWDRRWQGTEPSRYSSVSYRDTDGNGFLDTIMYDLDGDSSYETTISLRDLGIDDRCEVIDISKMNYKGYRKLFDKVSKAMWKNAGLAVKAARKYGVNPSWYAKMLSFKSSAMRYREGYWIQYYIYKDIEYKALCSGDAELARNVTRAYFSSDWNSIL